MTKSILISEQTQEKIEKLIINHLDEAELSASNGFDDIAISFINKAKTSFVEYCDNARLLKSKPKENAGL